MIVTTEAGSQYRIDFDKKTWERVRKTDDSGYLRTAGGSYLDIQVVLGDPMGLLCPPLTKGTEARYIETSPIAKMEEE